MNSPSGLVLPGEGEFRPASVLTASVGDSIPLWKSLMQLVLAAILCSVAWILEISGSSGTIIFIAPAVNSATLSMALLLFAIWPFIAGIRGLLRGQVSRISIRWLRVMMRVLGWCTGIILTFGMLASAFVSLLSAPHASYVLESPDDGRSVLVLNRSFLFLGQFPIYQPGTWPLHSQIDLILTDDGYDPFRADQFRMHWNDDALELEYAVGFNAEDTTASEISAGHKLWKSVRLSLANTEL